MAFCTQCGHKNVDDARFCEECGTPLKATAAPAAVQAPASGTAPVAPAAARAPANSGKLVKVVAIAVAVLLALGAGAFLLLAPESPSNERFAAAIEKSLAADSSAYKARYCLSNFAYDRDPVHVNDQDLNTRRWLAVLTKAGLYAEPEVIDDTSGFLIQRQLKYVKTEAGKKATQGRQLCIADGVTVAKVERFTPPARVGDIEASRATVTMKLRNPMPFVAEEETKSIEPGLQAEFSENVVLMLKEGKWVVADQRAVQTAAQAERQLHAENKSAVSGGASGGGLLASLKKLFSFSGGNPVIGHWKSQVMGVSMEVFEFDSDSMISNGAKVKVRYEVEDKRVTVYPEGSSAGMIIEVIDNDTLSMNMGLMEIKLTRSDK